MPEIRAFERKDLTEVAALLRDHLEGWDGDVGLIEASFLDHPWTDPQTPSLVSIDEDGRLTGFIGVHPRRISFRDNIVLGACCTHLVVHPASRHGGAGAQLIRSVMGGPQGLTWSDTTVPVVGRLWTVFGGRVDYARAADWMIVTRPLRWSRQALGGRARGRARVDWIPAPGFPVQAIRRLIPQAHPPTPPEIAGEDASVTEVVAAQPEMTRRLSFYVRYDEAALAFTLGQIERRGERVVLRIVRRGGQPIGWYAYFPRPDSVSRVVHLAAAARDAAHVLGELLDHARDSGSSAISGRYEPHLDDALRDRLPILGLNSRPTVHARDQALDLALTRDTSVLTRLDGEWTGV